MATCCSQLLLLLLPLSVLRLPVCPLCALQHTLGQHASLQALLDAELAFVASALQPAPDNESAWNYLRGLFALPGCRSHELGRQDKVCLRVYGTASFKA